MKVFISYAHPDQEFALSLANALTQKGIDVWIDHLKLNVGDNLIEKIQEGVSESDAVIIVLSKAFSESSWVQRELSAFAMMEVTENSTKIYPVLIEDSEIPVALRDRLYADFRPSFNLGLKHLLKALKSDSEQRPVNRTSLSEASQRNKESTIHVQVNNLRNEFGRGNLTLFCGAGISLDAGIPAWALLLKTLLGNLFDRNANLSSGNSDVQAKLAEFYQYYFKPSPLMLAQYLKNGLGNDFLSKMREALYRNNPETSDLINAIVELCRPQRAKQSLHAIITFNFDDLIELNLKSNSIKHMSIFKEGQRYLPNELPIYHVHGYLPRNEELTRDHQIVFSEDAYHSQFIDSFSWSNLIQLNHLNQNLCLFVGLSMTDPNLRRLLDVSMRKNPERHAYHCIFKKRYNTRNISAAMSDLGFRENQPADDFVRISEVLEEQDANNLGLTVIWVDEYAEIPSILRRIAAE